MDASRIPVVEQSLPPEDFIGVLNEKCLPDWAREKLMELTAPRQEEPATGEMKLE